MIDTNVESRTWLIPLELAYSPLLTICLPPVNAKNSFCVLALQLRGYTFPNTEHESALEAYATDRLVMWPSPAIRRYFSQPPGIAPPPLLDQYVLPNP